MTAIQQIIFDSLVISFFVLGIVAVLVGVGLVVCSSRMFRLFAVMNRYISTRRGLKPVSVQHDIGPLVRRYRLWFGAAFILGAAYSLYSLILNFNTAAITAAIVSAPDTGISYFLVSAIVEILRWFMVIAGVFALAVGIILSFAPEVLRAMEARADRWYSVRKVTVGTEVVHLTIDRWVATFPKASGLAITLGALIVVVSSGVMLCN